jgi:hypothetical protein
MATARRNAGELATKAMEGATAAATAPPVRGKPGRKPEPGVMVSMRIDPNDKAELQQIFDAAGVPMSSGLRLAALHVLRELKTGKLNISKSGLYPGR